MSDHIDEGYGDLPTPEEVEAFLEEFLAGAWIRNLAISIARGTEHDAQDLAQEGRILAWKAASRWSYNGSLYHFQGYLRQQARWGMLKIAASKEKGGGRSHTGSAKPSTHYQTDEVIDRVRRAQVELRRLDGKDPSQVRLAAHLGLHRTTVAKALQNMHYAREDVVYRKTSLDGLLEALGVDAITEGAIHLGDLEMAYHHGEIMQAVEGLPEVWREYVRLRFWEGYNDSEAERALSVHRSTWHKTVRPTLVRELAHLGAA